LTFDAFALKYTNWTFSVSIYLDLWSNGSRNRMPYADCANGLNLAWDSQRTCRIRAR